ncbi:MAG: FAD-dependent monooxygenase [Paracoccus sp. (in: a-proteobacteria)]|uniref:FAD-dependent monooxygenase n=1 Tax=Paracoccus sp. TaxID=267 RepID=UPI00391D5977
MTATGALSGRAVTVVGGGIGGVTAALALARRGAQVRVLERAPQLSELGAGLQLSPNGMRVLTALGLDQAVAQVSRPGQGVRLFDHHARPVLHLDMARHRPDASFRMIHRARLLDCLTDAARTAGVDLRLGQEVRTPPDTPLVIGADGLHSRMRVALNGREVPFFTGQTAWRALIPDDSSGPAPAQVFMGPGRHLVSYPLAGGLRNIVAVTERREWQDEGWSQPGDPDDLRAAFAGFGGPVQGWLAAVTQAHLWGLFRHHVAPVWQDGRVALLGDAAHPTLPFLAQGAVMAIEDAWVLAACLDADPDQSAALARYQAARLPRTARIVDAATANARNYHLTGARRLIGHSVLRLAGRFAPGLMPARFDWLYDFDPVAEAL